MNATRRLESILLEAVYQLKEGVYDPGIFRAVFTAGGPASGKSFVASMTTGGLGLKVLTSDDLVTLLWKRTGHSFDFDTFSPDVKAQFTATRQKAKDKTAERQANFLEGRLGLIIDGTGADYSDIADLKKQLEELGYDCYMVFVNTTLDVAQSRNVGRYERNPGQGRKVFADVLSKKWHQAQDNLSKFRGLFGHNFVEIDNSVDASMNTEMYNTVWKQIMKFVKQPIRNSTALQWMRDKGARV
jgi:hypothetical protein